MTFRSETETLRARVEQLEREKAELAQTIDASRSLKRKPLFDPLRLFRRMAWFLLASTEWWTAGHRELPTAWAFFCIAYFFTSACVALCLPSSWLNIVTPAVTLALPLLRVWIRYGMRLDDIESRTQWEKRFD